VLILFGLANICYQLGTVWYDTLLWTVAPPDRLGQTSGMGAGCGYLGSLAGLLLLWPFVHHGGYQAAFVPSAGFFLLFALPCFFFLRDPPRPFGMSWLSVARSGVQRLSETVRAAKAFGGVWRYLWASFFSMNAIYTVLFFMAVFTRKVAGFSLHQTIQFFLFCQVFTIAGSLIFGQVIPRWGAKRTLRCLWLGWIGSLAFVALQSSRAWLWIVGPLIGLCLGSTFATARVLLMELSPKDRLGEMFGLAGLFNRASAILGPLGWGLLVGDPTGYQHGLFFLMGLLAIGLWLLRAVPVPEPIRPNA
jgi:UMF1 family MFS transporter